MIAKEPDATWEFAHCAQQSQPLTTSYVGQVGGRITRRYVTVVLAAVPEQALRPCGSLASPNRGYRRYLLIWPLMGF